MTRFALGGLMATLLIAAPTRADDPPVKAPVAVAPSKTYVVLVGISNYADKQIKARVHAEADATAFFDLFTDKQYLGVPRDQVKLLLGTADEKRGSEPATRDNILKSLAWLAKTAGPHDLVVYGFFGEGGPLGDTGDRTCYFASDTTFKNRAKDGVAAAEIGDALKPLKSTRFCVFMDVNFKGFTVEKGVADVSLGQTPYKEFLGDDGTEDHTALPGRVLFLATNGLHAGIDGEKHSLFTEVALTGLKGAADKEGYEPDGTVTVDELAKYLDKELPPLAAKLGKTKEEKDQAHFVLGTRDSHFGLTKNPAETAKVVGRLEKFEAMVKNGKVPATYADEGKGLLERMPKLEAQRKLRKEYQELVDGKLDAAGFEKARDAIIESTKLRRTDALTYASKVMDAIKIVREEHVKVVSSAQMLDWGIKGLYRRLEEPIPADIETKLKNLPTMREADQTQVLVDARLALGKREDLDNSKDLSITLQRCLSNLDPYTTYIDAEQKQKFEADTRGNFTGIGIQIRKDAGTDQLLVVTPIWESPAHKAGLQAGDIVTKIVRNVDSEGKRLDPQEVIPTKGLPLSDAVKKILGKKGTQVTLVVSRDGAEKEITVTRDQIDTESVLGYKREADTNTWNYWVDEKNKIAYIRLTSFQEFSDRDMKRILDDMKADKGGVKGLVLDLRFNPGGYLTSAVKITDLFIDDGKIVTIKPRVGREQTFSGKSAGSLLDFPMVCLVNGYSASGSEIVSAALQDHKRALILGERSYGKGSVQHTQKWDDGLLKFTVASFWRPSGVNLNKSSTGGKEDDDWGVKPDKVVPLTRKDREDLSDAQRESEIILPKGKVREKSTFQDKELDSALDYLREQIKTGARTGGR
jgi:C-terminal peptidase prc